MMQRDLAPQFVSPDLGVYDKNSDRPLDIARGRLWVVAGFFVLCFLIISLRLVEVMTLKGPGDSGDEGLTSPPTLHLGRGNIVDRNGELLATVLTTSSLYANPKIVIDPEEAAAKLITVLPYLNKDEIKKRLSSKKGFTWIARHLTPQQKSQIINLGIPGVDFMRDEKRVYPDGPLLSHVMGYTDPDGKGIAGVEHHFDLPLKSGDPLKLSIDKKAQYILRTELLAGIEKFMADGASGLILDIHTGEVLAMVSLPDFDPNKPPANDDTLFNKVTSGVYEMGSVLKIPNTAMALEYGVANLNSRYDATQPIRVGRFSIKDYKPKNMVMSVAEVFVHSSNIGSAKMAMDVGPLRQQEFMKAIGFFEAPSIELPEVGKPSLPPRSAWKEASTMTIAYGYGMAISPLQYARALAAITNGGTLRDLTLLKQESDQLPEGTSVVSPETTETMLHLMYRVATEGTAKKAQVPGYWVGGKTGTANKRSGRSYISNAVVTTFVGVFPEKPKYAVLVMMDNPRAVKGTHGYTTAGWNAAPIAGQIIARIAPLFGVKPTFEVKRDFSAPLIQVAHRPKE